MAEQKRKISYGIDFEVNDAELKKLKKQLEQLKKLSITNYARQQGISLNNPATAEKQANDLTRLKKDAAEFQRLMRLAYNPKTNSYNITKFNKLLSQSNLEVTRFRTEMQKTAEGRAAWAAQTHELTKFNTEIKQSHKLLDSLGKTLANTIKWTISSSLMQGVTRSVSQAYGFAKNLDGALNDIRIVTGKSADEMARFAERANAVASNLGKGTNDYTRAALIYAQQGLGQKEIEEKTAITLKTANVTGQSAEEVSEELTAVWNGYKVSAEQAELYVDRLAAVASTTASNLQELSTGMSKVASAAASLGVGEDQLAAQLSTIISVTRQAPETVGTALRTVYARITDIKAGLDEDGVTLGKYSGDMAKIGINVLDLNGNLRNMGEVMEEIGSKWSTMTQEQKIYLAQTMAGQRQYSNLMALFDNFDKYESALNTAQKAEGTLQEQQDIYMDRLSTHVQQLTTATEHMWMGLVDTDGFKDIIDGLTTIVEKVDKLFQSIGGGKNLLQSLVPIVMSLTSKTVASGINTMIMNSQLQKRQFRDQRSSQALAQKEMRDLQKEGQQGSQRYQIFKQESEFLQAAPGTFSTQQMDEINKRWSGSLEAAGAADKAKTELNQYSDITRSITTTLGNNAVDLKETLSIKDLENAIIDVGGQYDELSKKIEQYARDQDAISKQQDAARQKLIEAYSQAATKIASEKNESQFKQFNLKNLRKYESTQAQIISQEQQKLDSLPASSDEKKYIIDDKSPLKGMFDIMYNEKSLAPYRISAIEKVKGFEEVKDIKDKKRKNEKIKEILENSIYKEIFDQMPGQKKAEDFKNAVQDRFAKIDQNAKKAIQQARNKQKAANQELLRRQQMTNTYQAFKSNLQIQNVDKFQNNLKFLSQDFSSMVIPPELKTQIINIKKEYQELSQAIIKYNGKIQLSSELSQEQIDALKEEKKALEEKQQVLLDTAQGTVDSINADVQNKGQQAIDELKYSETVGNNNTDAIGDIQDDANRQAAIQSAIQLVSALGQVQIGFENFLNVFQIVNDDTLSFGEKFSQTLNNLIMSIPIVVSGIVSMSTALKTLMGTQSLHAAIQKIVTKQLWANTAGLKANTIELFENIGASLKRIGSLIASFGKAAGGLGWIAIAATTLMAITNAVTTAQKKAAQAQIKANEKIIDQEKKKQEEIKHNQDIISEVQALNKSYEDGAITRQELEEKTQELQEKYKDQSDIIKQLTSNYLKLGEASKKAREKINKQQAASLEKGRNAAGAALDKVAEITQTDENLLNPAEWISTLFSGQTLGRASMAKARRDATIEYSANDSEDVQAANKLSNILGNKVYSNWGGVLQLKNFNNAKQAKAAYDQIKQAAQNDPRIAKIADQFLDSLEEKVGEYTAQETAVAQNAADRIAIQQEKAFQDVDNFQEYNKTYEEIEQEMRDAITAANPDLSAEEIDTIIQSKISSLIPTEAKQKFGLKKSAVDKFKGDQFKNLSGTMGDIQSLINVLDEKTLSKIMELDPQVYTSWDQVREAIENVSNAVDLDSLTLSKAELQKAAKDYENYIGILQKTSSRKKITQKEFDMLDDDQKAMFQKYGLNSYQLKDPADQKQSQSSLKNKSISALTENIETNEDAIAWKNNQKGNVTIEDWDDSIDSGSDVENALNASYNLRMLQFYSSAASRRLEGFKWKDSNKVHQAQTQLDSVSKDELKEIVDTPKFKEIADTHGISEDYLVSKRGRGLREIASQEFQKDLSSKIRQQEEKTQELIDKNQTDKNKKYFGQMVTFLENNKENLSDTNILGKLSTWKDAEKITEDMYKEAAAAIQDYQKELDKVDEDEANQRILENIRNINEVLFDTDKDIDQSILAYLAQQYQEAAWQGDGFDKALVSNANNARDAAEEVLRYSAAYDSLSKKYGDWSIILSSGSLTDQLKILPDLKNTYADLLDVTDDTISNTFASSSENLELLKTSLNGTYEQAKAAYEELQKRLQQALIAQYGISEEIQNNIINASGIKDILEGPAGAQLSEEDQTNFMKQLQQMQNFTGMTAEAINAYLKSIGLDVDLATDETGKLYNKAATGITRNVDFEKKWEQSEKDRAQKERERIKNQEELTKFLKDERDIYHQINKLLSDQERVIKRITRNQQDMYGTELLDNLNAESAEYEKQQKLLKSKQKLQQQDLANKKAGLASKGASFDANGNISNYNNLIGSAMNNVNSIISRERGVQEARNQHLLNGGSTSDEIYKGLDAQLSSIRREKNKANYYLNDLKTDLSNYEKVKDQAEDVADQLTELSEKQIEINLKKFNMKLEVTLDLSQAEKTWNDYKRNVLQHDDVLNPNKAKSVQKDNEQRMADINSDSRSLDVVNQQIEKAMADNGTLYKTQGQKKKAIEELQKKAIQLRKGILENEDAIKQTYLEQYDIISEMFEKQKSQYDFVNNQLEHNKNMMSLVYGENNYAAQNVYNDKMIENNLKSIESMNNRVQIAEENLRKAKESGDTAVIEKAEAEWQTAIQNRNQLEEQSAQLMKDRYTTAINQIAHQMEQKLTNNKGFNYMDTEWDLMKKQSNLYLDDVNSAFAVKNTEYLYNQVLNDTKGLKSQQQLKKVMSEQLDILKEKDKLTQYDVDRAQKVLEIEKARIALEQARNNKTQMRLKRDSQGNYSYQYVADQDNIAKAENDLQKAENDLYNFDKENYENKLKEAYDATKEYQEKITALGIEYATATEERRKQIDEEKRLLDQQYSEYILNLSQETEWGKQNLMQSTMMNFSDMMNQEQIDFENMSDAQKEKWLEDMVPSINSGIAEMIGKFSTDPDSFKQIVIDATQAMDNERKTYQQGLADLQEAAGQNWNNIKQAIDPVVELQDSLIEDNDRLKDQAGEIVDAMNGTLEALNTQAKKWENVYNKTDAAVKRVYDYIEAIDKAAEKKLDQDNSSDGGGEDSNPIIPIIDKLKTFFGNIAPDTTGRIGDKDKVKDNSYRIDNPQNNGIQLALNNYYGKSTSNATAYSKEDFFKWAKSAGFALLATGVEYNRYINQEINDIGTQYGQAYFLKTKGVKATTKFDTGGYTGDWSSSQGRLAVLHQKELVLNKQDTANMLKMIAMVREMQQQELQFRLSSLNNEIQDVMKQNAQVEKIKTQQKLLEQSVAISASFPSVNSKKEIEEALSELMNKATQIALKYKKN